MTPNDLGVIDDPWPVRDADIDAREDAARYYHDLEAWERLQATHDYFPDHDDRPDPGDPIP